MSAKKIKSIEYYSRVGIGLVILLFGCVGGWAALAPLNSAVIAPGTVVVMGNSKKVQHLEGGIVKELFVRDGQNVKTGDLLIRLDETEIKANLVIVESRLNEFKLSQARLEAELAKTDKIKFPIELLAIQNNYEIDKMISNQKMLFKSRRDTLKGKKELLLFRITQLEKEIAGLEAQKKAKEEQSALIQKELAAMRILREKDLVTMNRLLSLQREASRLQGAEGDHVAGIARAKGKIAETRASILQIDQENDTQVLSELREMQAKVAEYVERRNAAKSKLERTEIRAPKSGFVHQLNVHTIGGVITPSEAVMYIVPKQELLLLEARVEPQSRDQVKIGQSAVLRFTAFDQRTTPELFGEVSNISADLTRLSPETLPFYTVQVKITEDENAKLIKDRLKPGMPAEIFIQTGARTALNYFLKPLLDQMEKAGTER